MIVNAVLFTPRRIAHYGRARREALTRALIRSALAPELRQCQIEVIDFNRACSWMRFPGKKKYIKCRVHDAPAQSLLVELPPVVMN